ncbi:hypothetical protein F5051DRAFT_444036 [Lentinula edodes]|nr:hypothetical protein F5051DRAFT_444036 [Lentinula edodes]
MKIKHLQKILTRTEGEPTHYLWFNEGGGVVDTHMKIGTPCHFCARAYGEGCDGCLTDLIPVKERTNPRWVDTSQNLAVANFNAIDHTDNDIQSTLTVSTRARAYGEGCDGRLTDLIPVKERTNPRWVDTSQNLAVANFNAVDHTSAPLPEALLPQTLNGVTIDVAFTLRDWKFGRNTLVLMYQHHF